ncbi:glycosyltransferase family 4 protein [Pseudoalteromonas fenneropenaei]|uniref:Glycosyltransferase family 4 protein n=1 Tax=Pseudoalteromonas fenneropenaei TaxID=1737459 RepID=A0ABV7CKE5_9GAMM
MRKKVLINAANLHCGGGVQVAASFISELANECIENLEIVIFVSTTVHENVQGLHFEGNVELEVVNVNGFSRELPSAFDRHFDLIFTVFGPVYFTVKVKHIVGFANAWILYPDNETLKRRKFLNKMFTLLKLYLQRRSFQKADRLVVELEHVKEELVRKHYFKAENIDVVYNCVSSLYFDEKLWLPLDANIKTTEAVKIGFLGRNYPHKNTNYLLEIKECLKKIYNIDSEIYVTFTDEEWGAVTPEFKNGANNLGSLNVNQCPAFYQAMDLILFPSFLECFSATPFEAMLMNKPVFASDKPFIRDACAEHVFYIDPNDASHGSKVIVDYLRLKADKKEQLLYDAKIYAKNFSSAKERAENYIKIIKQTLI